MDEEARLAELRRYRILDTDPEPQFDRVADIAKRQFGVPIALVAFMDAERNFLKARGSLPFSDSPRDISFCGHTILDDAPTVVRDTLEDERFRESPLVHDGPKVRFYAGAPLVMPSGHRIGTVCLIDTKPREFSEDDAERLQDLASIVVDHLHMRYIVGDVHEEIETRRAAEAEAHRLAFFDALTGLPNRAALQTAMADGLPFGGKDGLAALFFDIDDFKAVNDALGHQAGDALLKRIAESLRRSVGERGLVARISGDEFVVFVDARRPEQVERWAKRLLAEIGRPLAANGVTAQVGASIGLAFGPDKADPGQLLTQADLALQHAKRHQRGRCVTFSADMAASVRRRRRVGQDLDRAMAAGEIDLAFQPIVRAGDGGLIGVEALARWRHPELGPLSPLEFIGIAEETGQIVELGRYILRRALAAGRGWPDLFVSVNLSSVQFQSTELVGEIDAALAESGFPPRRLELELTESFLLGSVDLAKSQIDALHARGVSIALDDFGTGYSSLSYLRRLPFDKVKIDRSFVTNVGGDPHSLAIVQCITGLARQLGMRVTAEGIETEAQAVLLAAAGCGTFQGYHFGKPMPAAAIGELVAARPRLAAAG
jgi:diguanylate cyclase (GGDEF)-like protein